MAGAATTLKPVAAPARQRAEGGASAHLVEVFGSVQGEGLWVGTRQVFLRFYGCHLSCRFCDTPETITARQPRGFRPAYLRLERTAGRRDFEPVANPVSPEELLALVLGLDLPAGLHHSVALTGGEPLLHAPFLERFLPLLRSTPLQVYLETAGDLPAAVEPLLPWLDMVAMDVKLPSVTGERPRWDEHAAFVEVCRRGGAALFAKAIVDAHTDPEEVERAALLLAAADPSIPLVLQPLTPFGPAQDPPTAGQLLDWQALARRALRDVRVIPQCHKGMGQL